MSSPTETDVAVAVTATPEEQPVAKRSKTDSIINLCAMGFCGIDETVSVEALHEVSAEYGGVPEWGVLFRPEMEGKPRFPRWQWVTDVLCKANEKEEAMPLQLAGHLCSTRCQEVLNGDATFVKQLVPLGFKRVQINATKANNVDTSTLSEASEKVRAVILAVPEIEFILQRNEETRPLWEPLLAKDTPTNVAVLFDDSVGTGVLVTEFTKPLDSVKCGYAGGIGPSNVLTVLKGVKASVNQVVTWIDMESSLRTVKPSEDGKEATDIFDIAIVRECLVATAAAGVLPAASAVWKSAVAPVATAQNEA